MSETITRDEWLAELERVFQARAGTPQGQTARELADALGWTDARTMSRLRRMHRAGRLETSRELRPAMDGSLRWSPVYRIVADHVAS